ncbi:MAG: hypothetical protein J6U15_01080, partial [Lachnospiraceae bacterium]|nr:hypothetical protein [Lachnospiraceae bacterium]
MVKKNLVNKNVVRALSIGLSLAMASQPMMAMAADGETPASESKPTNISATQVKVDPVNEAKVEAGEAMTSADGVSTDANAIVNNEAAQDGSTEFANFADATETFDGAKDTSEDIIVGNLNNAS